MVFHRKNKFPVKPFKRLLCLILVCLMAAGTVPAKTFASEKKNVSDLTMVRVMNNKGTVRYENALQFNGTWYFSTDFFSDYTGYVYQEKDKQFVIDENVQMKLSSPSDDVFRKIVKIDTAKKTIGVKGAVSDLEDTVTVNGKLYLPAYQVLPFLDAACTVQDDTLCITTSSESFSKLLDGLRIDEYYFDGDEAFPAGKYGRKAVEGFAWLWDTITSGRRDRLVPKHSLDKDVRTVLAGYMTDTDGMNRYASKMQERAENFEDVEKRTVNILYRLMSKKGPKPYFTQVININQNRNEFFPKEAAEASDVFFEALEEESEKTKTPKKLLGYAETLVMGSVDYYLNSLVMIDDHVDMLTAVFPDMKENDGKWETEAQFLYEAYKDKSAESFGIDFARNMVDVIYNDIVLGEGVDLVISCLTPAPVAGIEFVFWLGGQIVELVPALVKTFNSDIHLYAEDIGGLAVLEYHLSAQEHAREAFEGYLKDINVKGNYTQENLEKLRLSAIMTLLVSKKCYTVIRDNSTNFFNTDGQKAARQACEAAINQITDKLADLYEAGAYVLADGEEYFESAMPAFKDEFESLVPMNDSLLKLYWNFLLKEGLAKEKDLYLYMEDINGDGLDEMYVTVYKKGEAIFYTYSCIGGEIKLIDKQSQKEKAEEVKCVFLTDDKDGYPGLLTLDITVDTYEMQEALKEFEKDVFGIALNAQKMTELIFSCVKTVGWEFTTFDAEGVNDIPDYGLWTGGKDKPGTLLDKLSEYQGTELMLFQYGDSEVMKLLEGNSSFVHNTNRAGTWFDAISERYDGKPVPEDEIGTPGKNGYKGQVGLPAVLFEYSALVWTLSQYKEFSYLVKDIELDGDNELLMSTYDSENGVEVVVTADVNDGTVSVRENGSAAGGFSFAEHKPDGKTLLKEYYYSAMNGLTSYNEWTGSDWKEVARMEETTEEDSSGNWVSKGSGTWWGVEVSAEEFRTEEGMDIADILRGYSPDMTTMQLSGNVSEYEKQLYDYLRTDRYSLLGLDPYSPLTAYGFGDLDLDGTVEDIYVVIRPSDPWLAAMQQEPGGKNFPKSEECSFIIVADKINSTTYQLTVSYHWDDFNGEIYDSDISVKDGVLKVKDEEFAYNGTYIMNMDYIG